MFLKKKNGFTLIELLVTIAIIGIIAGVVMVSYGSVQKQARDKRRVAETEEIRKALLAYYTLYGRYPSDLLDLNEDKEKATGCAYDPNGWDIGNATYGNKKFLQPLVDEGIIKNVPKEIKKVAGTAFCDEYTYKYRRIPGICGCPSGKTCAFLYARCEGDNCTTGETPSWCTGCTECDATFGYNDRNTIFYILEE